MKSFASFQLEKRPRPKGVFMGKDSKNARLSAKQRTELKALQTMSDSEIKYDDIPKAVHEEWQGAVVARFYKWGIQLFTVVL